MPGSAAAASRFRSHAVLIAEPNPLIALDLMFTVGSWGAEVQMLNDLSNISELAASAALTAAIVDVNLPLEGQERLIDALRENGVPTALTTTTLRKSISDQFPGCVVFEKPVDFTALADWFNDL